MQFFVRIKHAIKSMLQIMWRIRHRMRLLLILEALAASKGFQLTMGDTCDFLFGRLCCDQVS